MVNTVRLVGNNCIVSSWNGSDGAKRLRWLALLNNIVSTRVTNLYWSL